nr:udp-glycosyltransferase 74e2 [Quercus suber]
MERETHILAIPYPLQGHINPMLQFSKRLATKGARVTLVATSTIRNSMQALQGASSVNIEIISDGSEGDENLENLIATLDRFKVIVSQSLSEYIEKLNSSKYPPKFIVYDHVLPWTLDVAKKYGLDGAPFFTQSCAVNVIYYHLKQGTIRLPIEGPTVSLPSLPKLTIDDISSFLSNPSSYPALLNLVMDQFSNFLEAKWLFFSSFMDLELEVVNWMASQQWPIKTIGPTIPSMYLDKRLEDDKEYGLHLFKPDVDACIKWLDTKESHSVVYTSFGSLASLGEEQMQELTWGLKNSNCYFLCIVRETEQKKLPTNFLQETAGKGLVVGVRIKLDERGIATKEEIELCIREVIGGERGKEMRGNSIRWKELAKEAMDEGRLEDDKEYGLHLFKPDVDACIKWLDTKESHSVVYTSFGSLASLGEEQMQELTWGLKNSNCYFLCIVRETEQKKLPTNFLQETAGKGLVVGVRIKLDERGIATKEEIELCIREVIGGERGKEMRGNSIRWKELAKEAMDEGGSSDKNIEDFVAKLVCS